MAVFTVALMIIPASAVTIAQLRQQGMGGNNSYYTNVSYVTATGIQVLFEYSADGVAWHGAPLAGDEYFRTSSDGGSTWGSAVLFLGPQGATGLMNQTPNMTAGPQGPTGATGATGPTGPAGQVAVNNTFTGATGSNAIVTNVGTATNAELDFTIPGSELPVGSTAMTTNYANPATILGYGTWQFIGNVTYD